jgi:two-component system nitrogen regulation sensor histidine kinase NtrY
VVPSVMMCVFSAIFFHNGIESWFNKRNQTVLQESLNVAESYLREHKHNALTDCIAISKTLEYHIEKIYDSMEDDWMKFSKNIGFLLDDLCGLKGVDSAILLDADLNVVAHSKYSVSLHFLSISFKKIKEIEISPKNGIILDVYEDQKSIVAASCFKNSDEYMYLIIEKSIDSNILSQAKNTRIAYDEYFRSLKDRNSLEIAFIFMFLIVGILLLIASILVAIVYSWRIVKPVSNLIDVSEEIINGNLKARAKEDGSYEEIKLLSKTFNQMIKQIDNQREDLVRINRKLDERIKFTASVLAGVSSGVIGIDNYTIYIWNTAAEKLLGGKIIFGEHIGSIFPEIVELLKLMGEQVTSLQREIQFKKQNQILLFSVKIENLTPQKNDSRFVVTFSDLTDMIMVQRKAAWSEVARRVAHEIKNPLTPIQLSAERIKRKYLPQITEDTQIFSELINVIVRQVGDIKRLIDEFNFFARLPNPNLKECNPYDICNQAVLLMQNASDDVDVTFHHDNKNDISNIRADEQLLHQSVVNLIQNAINALSTVSNKDKKVVVSLEQTDICTKITVEDNGPGFPKEKIEALTMPYFTLMPKGTGLGLAIVKKIVQDHGGELFLEESSLGGAKVIISISFSMEVQNES